MGGWILKAATLLAGLALATPAVAQTIDARKLSNFTANSVSNYGDLDDYSFEDILFNLAKRGAKPADVLDQFAKKLGVSRELAAQYATLLIDVSDDKTKCDDDRRQKVATCGLHPGATLYARVENLALAEPTGGLLFSMAANISLGWSYDEEADQAELARLAARHPASVDLLGRLYAYGHDAVYLIPLITAEQLGDDEAIAIAEEALALPPEALMALLSVGKISDKTAKILAANAAALSLEAVNWEGWADAMLESAEQKTSGGNLTARAGVAQAVLTRKLDLGMDAEAVAAWYAYPSTLRATLPFSPAACTLGVVCNEASSTGYAFNDSMAAALWVTGHREDALTMVSRTPPGFEARGLYDDKVHAALSEAMTPILMDSDLFGAFVEDRVAGWTRPSDPKHSLSSFGAAGWLFNVQDASPAVRAVVAARLREAGHADMADYLSNIGPRERLKHKYAPAPTKIYAAMLPPQLSARAATWEGLIAAADQRLEAARPEMTVRVSTKALASWWTEKKLPQNMKAWKEGDEGSAPPERLKLPVALRAVLRYAKRGVEHAIIYLSADYDLPGEVPAFGVWFAETDQGVWQRPVYLGLQQHFPYVVTPASRLPLIAADGKLTLEVRAEEIDAESISFPPVGLSLKRIEGGIYLEFDLAVLRADRDNDYLSDIEERKLGLDYANPDTDGDGVLDGIDPMPLAASLAKPSPLMLRVAQAIASKIIGHDVGAIMLDPVKPGVDPLLNSLGGGPGPSHTRMATVFLVADPAQFAGLSPDFRLMIYSEADVKSLTVGAAPFFPPRIINMISSLDGATHYVVWSATWVGGSFMVNCAAGDGPCDIKVISDWIT